MKSISLAVLFIFSSPVLSSPEIIGEFITVSESDCNSGIHFFENGKGAFIDYCRGEDGSYIGKVHKDSISWRMSDNSLLVNINGLDEIFTRHSQLSCKYFGEKGHAAGLVGLDLYFWKKPIKCK
jgi:hypothetical protein